MQNRQSIQSSQGKGYTYPAIAHVRSAVLGVPDRLQDSARNFNPPGLADTTDVYLPSTLHVQGGVGENPVQSTGSTCIFIIRSLGNITSLETLYLKLSEAIKNLISNLSSGRQRSHRMHPRHNGASLRSAGGSPPLCCPKRDPRGRQGWH